MMDNSNGILPVMPVGSGGDLGSNGFIWMFFLLVLLMGGNGFGWGNNSFANAIGYDNLATENSMQRGFDNQNSIANQREILQAVTNGTSQAVNAVNESYHNTVNTLSDKYSELARDVSNVQMGVQQSIANANDCCCSTKQLILTTSADTNAKIAEDKYDTSMQMAQMEARLTAKMDANEIQNLRDQVQQLQLQNATSNVLRYPNSWSFNGGYFPPLYGCGCQQNI
jgi:hypothetical protein